MSEVKQVKDDDSVELGSVLQLSPHNPTNRDTTVTRGKDGEEYISLDDVYEVTGQEAFQVVAANCREYLKNKRLHQSGFNALLITGVEGLVPGYDRLNSIKGGESFIDKLRAGFITVIKAVKRFCVAVVDWILLRIRTVLGFEKTETELGIQAEMAEVIKDEIVEIAKALGNTSGFKIDVEELYAALPGPVTDVQAFTIIHNGAKTTMEQLETLSGINKDIEKAEKLILAAGSTARTSSSRYAAATRKLESAFKNREGFTQADIIEYRHSLDKEIIEVLDPQPMIDIVSELVEKAWGIKLGEVGIDKAFKDTLQKNRDKLAAVDSVKVPPEVYENYRTISSKMALVLLKNTKVRYDERQLSDLKKLIEVKDAELIQAIDAFAPGSGVLVPTYSAYSGAVSQYISTLEHLINIVGQVRRSVAGVVAWANKIDKLMIGYLTKDIATILQVQQENLPPDAIERIAERDADGNLIGSSLDIDYDALFIARHPKMSAAVLTWRNKTGEFRKKYAKPINELNASLRKLGISKGI